MLPNVQDILVATDLSENSNNTLRFALSLAQGMGANLHILHVTEQLSSDALITLQIFMQEEVSRKEAINKRHASVKQMLKDNQSDFVKSLSADEAVAYDTVSSVELVDGHPAEEIMSRAKSLNCGLIVMGTHEQSTGHTYIGTVVKRVLRRSTIPTLVVPHP